MLKNITKRRDSQRFDIVIEHPSDRPAARTEQEIEDDMQVHYILVHNTASKLGYKLRRLSVSDNPNGVRARATVRAQSSEEVAHLAAAIKQRLEQFYPAELSAARPSPAPQSSQLPLLQTA